MKNTSLDTKFKTVCKYGFITQMDPADKLKEFEAMNEEECIPGFIAGNIASIKRHIEAGLYLFKFEAATPKIENELGFVSLEQWVTKPGDFIRFIYKQVSIIEFSPAAF